MDISSALSQVWHFGRLRQAILAVLLISLLLLGLVVFDFPSGLWPDSTGAQGSTKLGMLTRLIREFSGIVTIATTTVMVYVGGIRGIEHRDELRRLENEWAR